MEQALLKGELWAVAATNALELGVDIGSLDITLHLGFPGKAWTRRWISWSGQSQRAGSALEMLLCAASPPQHA